MSGGKGRRRENSPLLPDRAVRAPLQPVLIPMSKESDMTSKSNEFDEIILEQGSYWRAAADVDLPGVHRDDRETRMTILAGTVLLLQSIRDVDNTAHTIILRPHPSIYGMSVKLVIEYRDDKPHSWTWGELTECRFLVADFLAKFVPAPDAESVRTEELAAAQEYVRLLQRRLIEGQSDPEVMQPVLALGIGKWEKEQKLTPKRAAYIAEMSTSTALEPTFTGKHVADLKLRIEREHTLATVRTEWIKDRVAEIGEAVQKIMPFMEEQAAAALSHTEDIIRKVSTSRRSVESLDLYIGKDVTVETLCTGKSAPSTEPLTIGQTKLFMQEEFSVWAAVTEKFDFHREEQFLKALVENPSLQQQIFPSERSIICMATRRTEKDYRDPWVNSRANAINKEVFLLVRDGGNLYRVFSPVESHLRALQLFPSRTETDAIFTGVDGNNVDFLDTQYTDKLEKHELIALHYKRFLILLAGLDHRLSLFGTFYEGAKSTRFVSLDFQRAHFRFVHDADGLGMLPKPVRPSLDSWLKENNTFLRPGSRVMCLWDILANPQTAPGMTKERDSGRTSYYRTRHPEGEHEVAVVHVSDGELVVYCPTRSSSCRRGSGKTVVQSRVSVSAWKPGYYKRGMGYLVLDAIKADELEWYIHDRDSRVDHLDYIGMFKETVAYLRVVEAQEAPARAALLAALNAGEIGEASQRTWYVDQAVRTWRAEHKGAELVNEPSGPAWTELLNTMYTIANAASAALKVASLAAELGIQPLRSTVTGANKLVLYAEPKREERDDRIAPHIWVNQLHLEARKGALKVVRQNWTVLPAVAASETTLQEWPAAAQWAGLKSPFPSLAEKKALLELVNGTSVDNPWLREKVTPGEWDEMFEEWKTAYRRNNHNQTHVQGAHILFPVGLSVNTEKNKVSILAVASSHPEVRLWNLATAPQQMSLAVAYCAPYRYSQRGRDALDSWVSKKTLDLYFVITQETARFPKVNFDFESVRVLLGKSTYGASQDSIGSLDERFKAAVRYLNKFKARNDIPYTRFHLNRALKTMTLDKVFEHYGEPLQQNASDTSK